MAYSRVTYTGDGSTAEFSIPFPYLNLSSIRVRVEGALKSVGADYTINPSTSKVTLMVTPEAGAAVRVSRETPRGVDERLVVFMDPSNLDAATLNKSDLQLLYIIQEALDDIADGIGVGGGTGGGTGTDVLDDPDLIAILDDIIADHNAAVAALSAEVQSRSTALLAEHEAWVAALLAEAGSRNAAIQSAKNILETADTALAAQITVVSAKVNDPVTGLEKAHARVTAEESARASAVSAEASRISTLESAMNTPTSGLLARITNVENTLVSGADNTALAFRTSALESQVQTAGTGLLARVSTEESTRASQTSALGSSISSVSATANTANTNAGTALTNANNALNQANAATASVTAEATARATSDGNLSGQYVLKVTAGSRVAGMRITSVSNASAGDTSEIVFDATAFKVYNGSSNIVPFQVVGGIVKMVNVEATVLKVGSGLSEVNIGSGILKQGNFQTFVSGLSTLSQWRNNGSTESISVIASDSFGYLDNGVYLQGAGSDGGGFGITAKGVATFKDIKGSRLEFHPNSGAQSCSINTGESSGTSGAAANKYMALKINGRFIYLPFFDAVP